MKVWRKWWLIAVAIASLIAGGILARAIESGVRLEKVLLAGDTPAIRLRPETPGPHPIALLAHGATASKETLLRFGEALAATGFDCFTVDQAGHGESRQSFTLSRVLGKPEELARGLGLVAVFLGHSMGGGAGAWSVREAGFRPKLFIGVGCAPQLGEHGPPLLLLAGQFEEFVRPATLYAITNAQVVISPWSDHCLEPFDPCLVNAAVKGACDSIGQAPPAAPKAWRWRVAGLVLGMMGALVLMFRLPELHPRLARIRGVLIPAILLLAVVLTTGTWVGAAPTLRRIPVQLVLFIVIWLALAGLNKLRIPRGSLAVLVALPAVGCRLIANVNHVFPFVLLMAALGVSSLLLCAGTIVGRIAARGGTRQAGDLAMAIFASYTIGQCVPMFI